MRFQPYEKIVLESGEEGVTHAGGVGGIKVGNVEVTPKPPTPTDEDLEFLRSSGIEWNSE